MMKSLRLTAFLICVILILPGCAKSGETVVVTLPETVSENMDTSLQTDSVTTEPETTAVQTTAITDVPTEKVTLSNAVAETKAVIKSVPDTKAAVTSSTNITSGKYVINTNTKKFHIKTCRYVSQIKPENYLEVASREEAVAIGAEPCKVCDP